ncbi:hypothetical protein [Candidatus Macondimonas diazotrophica]|jgi:thiamine transporter ThiT|uniref:Uncharacterized protein n=1 Tax=Candidatus Macondimonas diazotrophica TaxID=2305248 RepID=A0A4Z0F5C9_9GAMM|nr:hypothetical protein [Candidatus Macondimonas diazotrophica]TFZ81467.1 hypothetical protein E4680_12365 [Candidatus Macondimonas diazotrophica]
MELLLMGSLTAIAFIILMFKLGIGRFVKFNAASDVIISGVLVLIFAGTFSGMVTGLIAGIIVSLFLWVLKGIKAA